MKKINILIVILFVIISSNVYAEIYKDKSGQVIGSTRTNSNGETIYLNKSGQVTGSARIDSNGTTIYRDKSGQVIGSKK